MAGAEIVRIERDNAHLLSRIAEDVFDDAIEAAALHRFLDAPGHALFVAIADGIVIGQIRGIVHEQPDRPCELYIDNLGVTPGRQRQGAARGLLHALAAWGAAQGCASFWVATETDNAAGLAFYETLGLTRRTLAWFDGDIAALG